jgi:hypothetical protein
MLILGVYVAGDSGSKPLWAPYRDFIGCRLLNRQTVRELFKRYGIEKSEVGML